MTAAALDPDGRDTDDSGKARRWGALHSGSELVKENNRLRDQNAQLKKSQSRRDPPPWALKDHQPLRVAALEQLKPAPKASSLRLRNHKGHGIHRLASTSDVRAGSRIGKETEPG